MLTKLDSSLFDFSTWRTNSIHLLGVLCRYADITSERGKRILRRYAIGYCKGENLPCRPKSNEIALMCVKDRSKFWFHLRNDEFQKVFIKGGQNKCRK